MEVDAAPYLSAGSGSGSSRLCFYFNLFLFFFNKRRKKEKAYDPRSLQKKFSTAAVGKHMSVNSPPKFHIHNEFLTTRLTHDSSGLCINDLYRNRNLPIYTHRLARKPKNQVWLLKLTNG